MALLEDLEAENAPLLAPITPDQPGGADPTLLPDFESIKAEIDKLTSVTGGEPDWARVARGAEHLLSKTAKDFRLLTWLAVARTRLAGIRGFASAMVVYRKVATDFWATAFPDIKRLRGRANAFAWMTESVNDVLDAIQLTPQDVDAVKISHETFTALNDLLAEKLADFHPGPGRLRGTMQRLARAAQDLALPPPPPPPPPAAPAPIETPSAAGAAPAPVAPPPSAVAPTAPSAATPSMSAAPVAVPTAIENVSVSLREVVDVTAASAHLLRAAKLDDPRPYRVLRAVLWMNVMSPPAAQGLRTTLKPPHRTAVLQSEALARSERWADLIDFAERTVTSSIFWLDLHELSARALATLGHVQAKDEVTRGVVALVDRFPQLLELQFSDERPLASPTTRAWIENERARSGGGQGGGAVEADAFEKSIRAAEELASAGQLGEGLAAVVDLARRAGSGRERFRTFLRAGKLALDRGAPDLARGMLESLVEDVDQHALEVWDPALCAELYRTVLQSLRAHSGANVDLSNREAVLFERLCRLDPKAALLLARK